MRNQGWVAIVLASLASMGSVNASEMENPGWGGEVELGVVETRGNSDTSTLKLKAAAAHESIQWINSVLLEALNTASRDITTSERYLIEGKTKYRLEEQRYSFANGKYEDNRFSGYQYRATVAVGYGSRLLDTESYTFDAEIGPGARHSKLLTGSSDDEVMVRLFGDFNWTINNYAKFEQLLTVEAGRESTLTRSESSLKSKIARKLAMKASYLVRHSSSALASTASTDRELTFTVVYDFNSR